MNKKYEKIKEYFNRGVWSKERVHDAVDKDIITKKEYESITGEKYSK